MENGAAANQPMGVFDRIVGIFTSPTETFQSIAKKPAWWIPFVISLVIAVGLQLWLMDIGMKDQIDKMNAKNIPQEQIEMAQKQMQGPMKYIGIIISPIIILIAWAASAGMLLLGTNPIMGGSARFGQLMGVVAWSSLVSTVGGILKSVLIYIQGTTYGVSTSLAALMPVPPMSEKPALLYQFLTKMDPFIAWQIVLWSIGAAYAAQIEIKKSAIVAFGLWALWIVVSLGFGQMFSQFM
ncbi:YIP1 family protein [bacterium]|nr:YIP1 family protein [bacterium]